MKEQKPDDLIGLEEASNILQCHVNTLRKWADKGLIPSKRFGFRRDRRFIRSEVEQVAKWDKKPE